MIQPRHVKHVLRHNLFHALIGTVILSLGTSLVWSGMQAAGAVLFQDSFGQSGGLITNEYAHWNTGDSSSKTSPDWELTSGSLFSQNGAAWSGTPDDTSPNATSSNGTDSAVFRLNTKRFDFGDVQVGFRLYQNGLSTSSTTPAVAWDGIHIFLRYQSEFSLYYASVNRRDGAVVIKKKCVGGSSNGGTYYELGSGEIPGHPIPYGTWQNVSASVQNNADNSVTIRLLREGVEITRATDTGTGCAPIRTAGATGIRGDNDDFLFDDFTVTSLAGVAPTPSPTPSSTAPVISGKATPTPTPSPAHGNGKKTPTNKALADSTSPAPVLTAGGKPAAAPQPLSPAAITLAARTQPNLWLGGLIMVLGALLAYVALRRHFRPTPRKAVKSAAKKRK